MTSLSRTVKAPPRFVENAAPASRPRPASSSKCGSPEVKRSCRSPLAGVSTNAPLSLQPRIIVPLCPPLTARKAALVKPSMNKVEVGKEVKAFLLSLKTQDRLFSFGDFTVMKPQHYPKGTELGRILGARHIEKAIAELGLKHIKVPKKVIVLEQWESFGVIVGRDGDFSFTGSARVWAERIQPVERKPTEEELMELLQLFETVGYNDIHRGNICIAADGIYIVDTKFVSLGAFHTTDTDGLRYKDMEGRLLNHWYSEDQLPNVRSFIRERQQFYKSLYSSNKQSWEKTRKAATKLLTAPGGRGEASSYFSFDSNDFLN